MENTKKGKKLNKALLMGTALVSLSSYQAQAATGTGSMSAIILAPIVVTNSQNLHFGSMTVAAATTGSVTVTTAGARSQGGGGGVTLVTGAAAEQEGILNVVAATGLVMDVTLQAGPFTVDDTGAGAPMTVNGFQFLTVAGGPTVTASIVGPATNVTIPVGATLTVAGGQTPGLYTGTYTVDVNYQ